MKSTSSPSSTGSPRSRAATTASTYCSIRNTLSNSTMRAVKSASRPRADPRPAVRLPETAQRLLGLPEPVEVLGESHLRHSPGAGGPPVAVDQTGREAVGDRVGRVLAMGMQVQVVVRHGLPSPAVAL